MSRQTKRFCTVGLTCLVGLGVVENRGNREWGVGSRRRRIVLVLVLVLGFLCSALTPMAFAQDAPAEAEALDVGTYLRVAELRERLRLSDGTLAAMGLEQVPAEAVLGRLVTWRRTNAAQWTARRRQRPQIPLPRRIPRPSGRGSLSSGEAGASAFPVIHHSTLDICHWPSNMEHSPPPLAVAARQVPPHSMFGWELRATGPRLAGSGIVDDPDTSRRWSNRRSARIPPCRPSGASSAVRGSARRS